MNKTTSMTEAEAYSAKLSSQEEDMLVKLATTNNQQLSLLIHEPNVRVMNSLVRKGMATDNMGTFWKITEAGRLRVTRIH